MDNKDADESEFTNQQITQSSNLTILLLLFDH